MSDELIANELEKKLSLGKVTNDDLDRIVGGEDELKGCGNGCDEGSCIACGGSDVTGKG